MEAMLLGVPCLEVQWVYLSPLPNLGYGNLSCFFSLVSTALGDYFAYIYKFLLLLFLRSSPLP